MQGAYGGLVVILHYGVAHAGPPDSFAILTETGVPILTETSDELLTEDAP